MARWTMVGFYHNATPMVPWGTYWGPREEISAVKAVLLSVRHAHENWPPERQITVCGAVAGDGGLLHNFGMVRSDDLSTWPAEKPEPVNT